MELFATPYVVLNGVATGTSEAIALNNADYSVWWAEYSDGTNAGEVIIETAPEKTYAGAWTQEGNSVADPGGAAKSDKVRVEAARFGRARVLTNMSGGADPKVTVKVMPYRGW